MTDQENDGLDALENEPVFICSQLRVGETLTQADVDAIQAILSELDKRENEDVDNFGDGREYGIREIGGEELLAAVKAKDDAYITKVVRETIAKMDARTAEIKAATLPEPEYDPPSPQPNVAPDAAARLERILRLGRSMKWTPHGAPALDDENTAVALGELFQIFFQDAVERALATTEGSDHG